MIQKLGMLTQTFFLHLQIKQKEITNNLKQFGLNGRKIRIHFAMGFIE